MRIAGTIPLWLTVVCAATFSGCAATRQLVQDQNPFARAEKHRSIQYDLAQVAEREGHVRHAVDQYRQLHKQYPKDVRYIHRLGVAQLRLGEHAEGVEMLEQASKLKPNDLSILNDLGYAYLELGELHQAEEQFQAALSINPNDRRAINNLGLCAGYDGRLDEAYKYFRRIGSEAEAQANLGYVLTQRGEIPQAMDRYSRALSLNPELRPAAEALVQLTNLSQDENSSRVMLAHKTDAADSPAVQQARAVEETADAAPALDKRASRSTPVPTMGFSAP